jgi:hypothetical protein
MTARIEESRDHETEASLVATSVVAIPTVRSLQIHMGLQHEAAALEQHPPGVARQVQAIPKLVAFLVSQGQLRLTAEHAEAWKPLRETWRETQKDQDNPDVSEFRNDVARIYDRAVKRAVHALEDGPRGVGRLKGYLEKYRYESLPPCAQAAAVDRTIETLDGLVQESESREEAKRLEATKATIQGVVSDLTNRGFLTVTHEFRVAYEGWRTKGKLADEDPGNPSKASEAVAAKKALRAAAVSCYKVAVFAGANSPDPTIRERFQPHRTRRLTAAETNWVASEACHILERLLFQQKIEHATPQSRETGPGLAGEAPIADTFPHLAPDGANCAGVEITRKTRPRSGAHLTAVLLLAETIGVAIGGVGGFLTGKRFEADKMTARMIAYDAEAQKTIDDVKRKANRFAEMNLEVAAENKTLKEALAKRDAAPPRDLTEKNAELSRINQALGRQNQELAERIQKQDQALDGLRNERDSRHPARKGGSPRKKS